MLLKIIYIMQILYPLRGGSPRLEVIMPTSNGLITAPVSIEDVRKTLGVTSTDLGTLCTSSQINMWSKYKPVQLTGLFASTGSNDWYKGVDGCCGINFADAQSNTYEKIIDKYTSDGSNGWHYMGRPNGTTYPYRLTDFKNYYHKAVPPLSHFTVPQKVAANGTLTCSFDYGIQEDHNLNFSDINIPLGSGITNLGEAPVGIVVYSNSQRKVVGRTGDGSFGVVNYKATGLTQGYKYTVYPFFCVSSFGQDDVDKVNTFITLPNVSPGEFTVVSQEEAAGITISVHAIYVNSSTITWTLTVTSKSSSYTFRNNAIYARFFSSGFYDSMMVGEYITTIPDFTVSVGGTVTKTGTFTNLSTDKLYRIHLSLNTGQYIKIYDVEMDSDME